MALVPGICTQCGATLSADKSKDCMICPYCETPFIVEKAINNFQNTYNISNSVVNIYGAKENDFVIRSGVLEKYNGSDTIVTIPDNVIAIGDQAFKNCMNITEITISEGVQIIGDYAFGFCRFLKKVTLPNSLVEIGASVFWGCDSLTEIYLPDSLQRIGYQAFSDSNLTKVRLPDNTCDYQKVQESAFLYCNIHNAIVPNESWVRILHGTPYFKTYWDEQRKKAEDRRRNSVCQYCGGKFTGILFKTCMKCNKPKDY